MPANYMGRVLGQHYRNPDPVTQKVKTQRAITTKELKSAPLPTLPEIEEILYKHEGNLSDVADELNVSRLIVQRLVDTTPSLRVAMRDIAEMALDRAEKELKKLVKDGNPTAVTFTLKMLGKERGYSERTTMEHELGPSLGGAAGLIEMMQNGSDLENEEIEVDYQVVDHEWDDR